MKKIICIVLALFCCAALAGCNNAKGSISGTVTDHLSEPLAGVTVTVGGKTAVTNSEGKYTLKRVGSQEQEIVFSKDGYGTIERIVFEKWFVSGAVKDFNVFLHRTAILRGSITISGAPAAGAVITVGGRSVAAGQDGKYILEGIFAEDRNFEIEIVYNSLVKIRSVNFVIAEYDKTLDVDYE